jgi:probable DNA metabolism protein
MIVFSPQVSAILKTAMLKHIHGDIATAKDQISDFGLFTAEILMDADIYDIFDTATIYEQKFAVKLDWLEEISGKQVKHLIQSNLRYNPKDYALILEAVTQALIQGPQYCLQCVSPVARKFHNQARAVQHEVHKMLGFIRFKPANKHTLVTQPKLFHHTADLILKAFQPRYPEYKLVIVLEEYALTLYQGLLKKEPSQEYLPFLQDDGVEQLWDRYYQSQYIESRKNIALAQKCIPQKYWDWMQEGQILNEHKNPGKKQ